MFNFNDYKLINENLEQARKILKDNNTDEDNSIFKDVKKMVSNNPGYLGLFTKFAIVDNVKEDTLKDLYKKLLELKPVLNKLPKQPTDYIKDENGYEKLYDDLLKIEEEQNIKRIINEFPSKQKKLISQIPNINDYLLQLYKMKDKDDFISKISRYHTKDDIFNALKNFINTGQGSFNKLISDLKNDSDIEILYQFDNIVVVYINSFNSCKTFFGNTSWCIASSEGLFKSYTKDFQKQYAIINYNLPVDDNFRYVGFTLDIIKKNIYTAHLKDDKHLSNDKLIEYLEKIGVNINDMFPNFEQIEDKFEKILTLKPLPNWTIKYGNAISYNNKILDAYIKYEQFDKCINKIEKTKNINYLSIYFYILLRHQLINQLNNFIEYLTNNINKYYGSETYSISYRDSNKMPKKLIGGLLSMVKNGFMLPKECIEILIKLIKNNKYFSVLTSNDLSKVSNAFALSSYHKELNKILIDEITLTPSQYLTVKRGLLYANNFDEYIKLCKNTSNVTNNIMNGLRSIDRKNNTNILLYFQTLDNNGMFDLIDVNDIFYKIIRYYHFLPDLPDRDDIETNKSIENNNENILKVYDILCKHGLDIDKSVNYLKTKSAFHDSMSNNRRRYFYAQTKIGDKKQLIIDRMLKYQSKNESFITNFNIFNLFNN